MNQQLIELNCPCCDNKIKFELKNGQLIALSPTNKELIEVNSAELLNKLNIEFG